MKIKICGLFREEDIVFANEIQPDYVGFVFYPKSHRNVGWEQARRLREKLDPRIPAVGVFVDEQEETMIRLLQEGVIDLAQLHGTEPEETVARIRYITGKPVIQAFRVSGREDVERAMHSPADYLLFDNGKGTGRRFDWEALGAVERPFFLAGGIDPENIRDAMERFRPYCIDVSSGAETGGYKDPRKMRTLVEIVREFSARPQE